MAGRMDSSGKKEVMTLPSMGAGERLMASESVPVPHLRGAKPRFFFLVAAIGKVQIK